MTIQRYNCDGYASYMGKDGEGDFVKYDDHQAEVQRLRVESSNNAAQAEEYRRERDRLATKVERLKGLVLTLKSRWLSCHSATGETYALVKQIDAECGKEKS